MRPTLVLPIVLSGLASVPFTTASAAADPAAKPEQVQIIVRQFTMSREALGPEVREQLVQNRMATGKLMEGILAKLAVATASGKASVPDDYALTLSPGPSVRFDPSQKGAVGLKVTLAPQAEAGQIAAGIELSWQGVRLRKDVATASGRQVAFSLNRGEEDTGDTIRVVLVSFTRLPRPAPM